MAPSLEGGTKAAESESWSGLTSVLEIRMLLTLDLKTGKCNIRLPLQSEARSLTIRNQSSEWVLTMDFGNEIKSVE